MPLTVPSHARCLTCGYLLRDLPANTCPECGNDFDPCDPKTFDAEPLRRKRGRWIRRGLVVAGFGLLLLVAAPRRMLTATLTFTCAQCNTETIVRRYEPRPPDWIGVRYPGLSRRSTNTPASHIPRPPGHVHQYDRLNLRSDLYIGGWCSASSTFKVGSLVRVNGHITTVDTAPDVAKKMLAPSNNGVSVRSAYTAAGRVLDSVTALLESSE